MNKIYIVVADFGQAKLPQIAFNTIEQAEEYIKRQDKTVSYFIKELDKGEEQ